MPIPLLPEMFNQSHEDTIVQDVKSEVGKVSSINVFMNIIKMVNNIDFFNIQLFLIAFLKHIHIKGQKLTSVSVY